jgi:predicted  nucleic acid-binding Zn-ribbon protein
MNNDNKERLQVRIDMIRSESRMVSYQIERLEERRHDLQAEKARLKSSISGTENE